MRVMRGIGILLLCATAIAGEDRASTMAVISAMREYYGLLAQQGNGNIESIRDRLIANVPHVSAKTQKSVRTMIDRGFGSKYKKDAAFHKCLAEVLASQGQKGLNKLFQRYKKTKKSTDTRVGIAEAFGGCKDQKARPLLLKIIHDKQHSVAGAAMTGLINFVPEDKKAKRNDMRALIDIYTKVTATAQGKAKDSKEREAYESLKPILDKALNAYSDDEKLDSAQAWDAWLRAQSTTG